MAMRKNLIILSFISILSFGGANAESGFVMDEDVPSGTSVSAAKEEAEAAQMIEQILGVVGLCQNFEIMASDVKNACAKIMNKKRYILFNPDFIESINQAVKTDWASISILAHEIGHHLNGHTITSGGSKPPLELEADEFSGFVLRKLGASLMEAQAAVNLISSENGSKSHPPRHQRLKAVEKGWKTADKQSVSIVKEKNQSLIPEKYILKEVKFYNQKNRKFFVTNNFKVVTVTPKGLFVVGKFASENDKPCLLLEENTGTVKYTVELDGSIANSRNKVVGELLG